jgi:hypothetical protein
MGSCLNHSANKHIHMQSQADPDSGSRSQVMGASSLSLNVIAAATLLLITLCTQRWNCHSIHVSLQLLWNQSLKYCLHTYFLYTVSVVYTLQHMPTPSANSRAPCTNKTWKYKNLTVIHMVTVLSYIFHAGRSLFVSVQCRLQHILSTIKISFELNKSIDETLD